MKKVVIALFALFSFTGYSWCQEVDDYDVEETDSCALPLDDEGYDDEAIGDEIELAGFLTQMFGSDIVLPTLGEDSVENRLQVMKFYRDVMAKKNNKAEDLMSLMMFLSNFYPKGSPELMREVYRIYMSSYLEFGVFSSMGGENAEMDQLMSAMRASISEGVLQYVGKEPDTYCSILDTVSQYVRNLDYMGDIYTEGQTFKPKEVQDSLVSEVVKVMPKLKTEFRKQAQVCGIVVRLMNSLYSSKNLEMKEFFTKDLCKDIKDKKLDLDSISPDRNWQEWDANDFKKCTVCPNADNSYFVILSEKDTSSSENFKLIQVTYAQEGDKLLINSINPFKNDDFLKGLEDSMEELNIMDDECEEEESLPSMESEE